jgi:hypothetical protein
MSNFTKPISTPNNTFANLKTLMKAAQPTFVADRLMSLGIFNPDGAVLLYIHLTDNGQTSPVTGTDGWPIGGAAGAADKTFYANQGANNAFLDYGTVWIFTASVIVVKVIAVGA